MDVWLIYRCAVCDETWNMPIIERFPVAHIQPDQLQSYMHNDPVTATRYAFDPSLLARHGGQIDQDTVTTIEKHIDGGNLSDATCLEIVMALGLPCRLRLDALLAREFCMTRGALLRAYEGGAIALASRKAMRAPAFDGQRLRIDLSRARHWGIDLGKLGKQAT